MTKKMTKKMTQKMTPKNDQKNGQKNDQKSDKKNKEKLFHFHVYSYGKFNLCAYAVHFGWFFGQSQFQFGELPG